MQDTLYPLSPKDVEAIGRSRVNRTASRNMKIWMWASLIVCAIGIIAYTVNGIIGIAIMILGVIGFFLYSSAVDKNRKIMVRKLKREWQAEKTKDVENENNN